MILAILLCLSGLELIAILRRRFETVLPLYMGALLLLGYTLAMFQALQWFTPILAALSVVGLAVAALTFVRKGFRAQGALLVRNTFTPAFPTFLLLYILFAVAAEPHRVIHTDDIYVWAIQPLSIYAHHGLVDSFLHLSPRFMNYMPGMHLVQWIGLTLHGEWSEGVLFQWLWLFYLIFLLPLMSRCTWKKAWQIPQYMLGFVLLPTVFDSDAYQFLRVDVALGICLGYTMAQAWHFAANPENRRFHGAALSLGLTTLVLIKQPGIGWAILPTLMAVLLRRDPTPRRRLRQVALTLILPLLVFGSWMLFCWLKGLTGEHINRLALSVEQAVTGQMPSPHDVGKVSAAVFRSLFSGVFDIAAGNIVLPQIVWFGGVLCAFFLLYRFGKMERSMLRKSVIGLSTGYLVFLLVFTAAMLTAFWSEGSAAMDEGTLTSLISNINRYGCALWYSLMILILHIALHTPGRPFAVTPARWPRLIRRALAGLLAVLLLLNLPWGVLRDNLIPGRYTVNPGSEDIDMMAANSFWRDDFDQPNAIVLLASDSYPYNRAWLQYALAPVKLIMPYETQWTEDQFKLLLSASHIGYFVSEGTENSLYQVATDFSEDGYLETYTVYAVQWDGDSVHLVSEDS